MFKVGDIIKPVKEYEDFLEEVYSIRYRVVEVHGNGDIVIEPVIDMSKVDEILEVVKRKINSYYTDIPRFVDISYWINISIAKRIHVSRSELENYVPVSHESN